MCALCRFCLFRGKHFNRVSVESAAHALGGRRHDLAGFLRIYCVLCALLSLHARGQIPVLRVDESSLLLLVEDGEGEAPPQQHRSSVSPQLCAALAPDNGSTGITTFRRAWEG